MLEQWLQREKEKTPGWWQRDVVDKRLQRMEEKLLRTREEQKKRHEEKRKLMEEEKLQLMEQLMEQLTVVEKRQLTEEEQLKEQMTVVEQWPLTEKEKRKLMEWPQLKVGKRQLMERRQLMEWRRQRMEECRQWMEKGERRRFERLRAMWDGEPDLEPLIEYLGADSMDVESIESGVVNEDTEVLSSLEQERERRRVQRLLWAKLFLRKQERHLLARGKKLLRERERERQQQRLVEEEKWREWEEDWNREEEREQEQEVLELESLPPAPAARSGGSVEQEPLLTEDVMDGLASTESVGVNEDTEEQQPLIGGMEADSTDVASIISGVVNQDTKVLLPLEREPEPRQELGSFPQAPGARRMEEWLQRMDEWLQQMDEEEWWLMEEEEWQRLKERGLRQWIEREMRMKEEKRRQMEEEKRRQMEEEKRQQMEEEKRQLIERLRWIWDGEPDLEPLIEYIGADSMDFESIESGVVNEDTEVLSSLEQERERRRVQRLLWAKLFLRKQEWHLLAGGKELLREREREREQQRLVEEEKWREWEEDWNREEEREQEQEVLELESLMPAPAAREPLLTEDVMDGLASTESVVVNEDTEEQQPLIGGMEADSSDVASIIFGVLNQDTEVHLSLESRQEVGSFPQAPGARVDLDRIFVITNLILELPSAVFDQLSSVRKPQFALLGMLMSYAALFICIVELVYKCRKEKVTWKWRGRLPWLYYPSQKPFGRFEDIIGLVCAICQCVVATIAYSFCLRHADNPIKISVWPIIFAFGLLCAKLSRDRREREHERGSTNRLPVSIEDIHYH